MFIKVDRRDGGQSLVNVLTISKVEATKDGVDLYLTDGDDPVKTSDTPKQITMMLNRVLASHLTSMAEIRTEETAANPAELEPDHADD